jgi:2-dehydropantoate 2-reductase
VGWGGCLGWFSIKAIENKNGDGMRILILGAGAVGCVIASALLQAGIEVILYSRGQHGRILREKGLILETPEGISNHMPHIVLEGEAVPSADYTFIAVKSYQYPDVAHLIPQGSFVIPIGNGIPWWFGGEKFKLPMVDRGEILSRIIARDKIIGGLTYAAATVTEPGKVVNLAPNARLFVGDIEGTENPAVIKLSEILEKAGFKKNLTGNIKGEIWRKLAWNISFNVLSVIYKMDSGTLAANSETENLIRKIIAEMQNVADALNLGVEIDVEKHLQIGRSAGSHKPSMLQDYEAGRRMEKEAILEAPVKIAEILGVNIPVIENVSTRFKVV